MGAGKTVSTLTAIHIEHLCGGDPRPAIVFAPKRVALNTWPDEAEKWAHLANMEVQPIIGTVKEREAALLKHNKQVFTCNYENIPWLIDYFEQRRVRWPFGRVVADESTKLKGFRIQQGTFRAQALAKIASQASAWTNLTGTPAPNGLIDLWGQQWFLDKGYTLGATYTSYIDRWFYKQNGDPHAPHLPLPHAQGEIEERLRPWCLSLIAADWFDLREPIRVERWVELPPKARDHYREMEKQFFTQISENDLLHPVSAATQAVRSQKLMQLANGAVYLDPEAFDDSQARAKEWREIHDAKLEVLEEIVEECAGRPVLVAYTFRSDLARILKAFPQARLLDDKQQTQRDWNAGKIPMLIAHAASAGHGLNLQDGGNVLVYFGIHWNAEEHQQIAERLGAVRQMQSGHKRDVYIYYILSRGTIDHDVLGRLHGKLTVEQALRQAMRRASMH